MKKTLLSFLSLIFSSMVGSEQVVLVEVNKIIPDIVLDIKYATNENFTKQQVYPSAKCYLVDAAAKALKAASESFNKKGYRIKVWDGYRPLEVQRRFWKIVPDERYVANPEKGSRHNRGCAVDITLIDKDGKEVDMGTEFDDFSEKAHRDYTNLQPNVIENRKLLEEVMKENGFEGLPTEWWHFDYKEWKDHPILDIPLDGVEK